MIANTRMTRRRSSRVRRERLEEHPHLMGHRFTLSVDNLCRIIRGMPDLRKQARLANQ
jgi:hypothetical protein